MTSGLSWFGSGPSKMHPKAITAASRYRQSGFLMCSLIKGSTWGTMSSSQQVARSMRQTPAALQGFQSSSSSFSSYEKSIPGQSGGNILLGLLQVTSSPYYQVFSLEINSSLEAPAASLAEKQPELLASSVPSHLYWHPVRLPSCSSLIQADFPLWSIPWMDRSSPLYQLKSSFPAQPLPNSFEAVYLPSSDLYLSHSNKRSGTSCNLTLHI